MTAPTEVTIQGCRACSVRAAKIADLCDECFRTAFTMVHAHGFGLHLIHSTGSVVEDRLADSLCGVHPYSGWDSVNTSGDLCGNCERDAIIKNVIRDLARREAP